MKSNQEHCHFANLASLLYHIGRWIYKTQTFNQGNTYKKLSTLFVLEQVGKVKTAVNFYQTISDFIQKPELYPTVINSLMVKDDYISENQEKFSPLLSIFQNVFKDLSFKNQNKKFPKEYHPNESYYYEPGIIQVSDVFPIEMNLKTGSYPKDKSIQQHKKIYESFLKEFEALKTIQHIEAFSFTLYYLLYKYTSRIAFASPPDFEDISLFDYSRVLTAVVNCVSYLFPPEKVHDFVSQPDEPYFILIKGDITGIQKFIYSDIQLDTAGKTKGLAKRLRGRSFYVSLLTDFLASLYMKSIRLPEANLIYSGGGHFLILAPYSPEILNQLNELEKQINLFLHKKLNSRLTFLTGKAILKTSFLQNISAAIQEVNHDLNNAKNQKFKGYLEKILFDEPQNSSWNEDALLGYSLPYASYLIEITFKDPKKFKKNNNLVTAFEDFNTYYFMVSEDEKFDEKKAIEKLLNEYSNQIETVKLYKINDTNFLEYANELNSKFEFSISYGFRFIGNYAPKNAKDEIISFEDLAKMDKQKNQELNFPLLGVLRLDLDNLGAIFALGLEKTSAASQQVSFARMATLSRQLHHFFSGYANSVAQKHQIYITYSGGDDAFFIGSWINILHFAEEFQKNFVKFTCKNPNFSISAGIYVCDNRNPIAKLAKHAADLEELSKKYYSSQDSKNAITVFENTLHWDKYKSMLDFAQVLLKHTKVQDEDNNNKLSRSLVYRLLRIIKSCLYSKGPKQGEINLEKLYSNFARLHYLFARHDFTSEKIDKAQDELTKEIVKVILDHFNKQELVKNYIIPMYYVLLKTRKFEK